MQLADFDYILPKTLIASKPLKERSGSRLLCLRYPFASEELSEDFNTQCVLEHRQFANITDLIKPHDLLVFNDTKVIPARLYGHKKTGGKVEVLIERILDEKRALVQLRASKPPHSGDELIFTNDVRLLVSRRQSSEPRFYELTSDKKILDIIDAIGEVPLPHYMQRAADLHDKTRYQTVYAKHKGSVAAPTAGLHFDHHLLNELRAKEVEIAYLTLHIGAGTFAPVRVANISEHQMHAEYFDITAEVCEKINKAKEEGRRVIAVGTTTIRALESAYRQGRITPYQGDTQIFIYPGYQFQCADVLITNFHLPRSTLLMLVCAFSGYEQVMSAYQEAITHAYRFYSYGDAMWMEKGRAQG